MKVIAGGFLAVRPLSTLPFHDLVNICTCMARDGRSLLLLPVYTIDNDFKHTTSLSDDST